MTHTGGSCYLVPEGNRSQHWPIFIPAHSPLCCTSLGGPLPCLTLFWTLLPFAVWMLPRLAFGEKCNGNILQSEFPVLHLYTPPFAGLKLLSLIESNDVEQNCHSVLSFNPFKQWYSHIIGKFPISLASTFIYLPQGTLYFLVSSQFFVCSVHLITIILRYESNLCL
jgi:hypothetical protein